jgi:hypothetical protein
LRHPKRLAARPAIRWRTRWPAPRSLRRSSAIAGEPPPPGPDPTALLYAARRPAPASPDCAGSSNRAIAAKEWSGRSHSRGKSGCFLNPRPASLKVFVTPAPARRERVVEGAASWKPMWRLAHRHWGS